MTRSSRPVLLREGVEIGDPVAVALELLDAWTPWALEPPAKPTSFDESDLRVANRGGARISSTESAAILQRRRAIERALRAIPADASLAEPAGAVPWTALLGLFAGFAGVRGVGFSKATKALHPKRPGLVPLLDSVVQRYLAGDDPGADVPFAERALALVRGYKRDLDRNRVALRAARRELGARGAAVTEVRILDLLIWSAAG